MKYLILLVTFSIMGCVANGDNGIETLFNAARKDCIVAQPKINGILLEKFVVCTEVEFDKRVK